MQTRLKRVIARNSNTGEDEEVEVIESFVEDYQSALLVRRKGEDQVYPISYSQIVVVLEHETTESQMEKVKNLWGELFSGLLPGLGGRSTDEDEDEDEPEDDEESNEIGITTEELRDLHERSKKKAGENKVDDEDKARKAYEHPVTHAKRLLNLEIKEKVNFLSSLRETIDRSKMLDTLNSLKARLDDGEDPEVIAAELKKV